MGSGLQFIAFLSLGFYTTYTSPRLHESIKKNIHLPLREEVESDADLYLYRVGKVLTSGI